MESNKEKQKVFQVLVAKELHGAEGEASKFVCETLLFENQKKAIDFAEVLISQMIGDNNIYNSNNNGPNQHMTVLNSSNDHRALYSKVVKCKRSKARITILEKFIH